MDPSSAVGRIIGHVDVYMCVSICLCVGHTGELYKNG